MLFDKTIKTSQWNPTLDGFPMLTRLAKERVLEIKYVPGKATCRLREGCDSVFFDELSAMQVAILAEELSDLANYMSVTQGYETD